MCGARDPAVAEPCYRCVVRWLSDSLIVDFEDGD
jgi:hypothetical protein